MWPASSRPVKPTPARPAGLPGGERRIPE
jgi:hypothetical protein